MLAFACPKCGERLRARKELAGKKARCPRCRHSIAIPAAPPRTEADNPLAPPRPPSELEATWVYTPETDPQAGAETHPDDGLPDIPGYEVLQELGRGAMGVVYRARQQNLDRVVAIKTVLLGQVTHPEALGRFEKEAVAVAKLRHPNIVTAFDFGRHEGRLFFVMELLEGEDLERRLSREGAMPEAAAWGLIRQGAAGLAHAAQAGLVHRDVKPANLFLVPPPEGYPLPPGLPLVKVTDFGLVFRTEQAGGRLTQAGTVLGTPAYMAPEQFGGGEVDHRADIYALGATASHALTGQAPFGGRTIWEIMTSKHEGKQPTLPPGVSTASADLLRDMMARHPARRVSSYQEVLERIDRILAAAAPFAQVVRDGAAPAPKATAAPRRRFLSRGQVGLLAAAPLLGVALLLLWWWLSAPPAPTMVPSANAARPLFDGTTLTDWLPSQGEWNADKDAEGGKVLVGWGVVRRPLPEWPHYRLNLNADPAKAAAVELHFGLAGGPDPEPVRNVLRLSGAGVVLGQMKGDRGELRPAVSPAPAPARTGSPYLELRVERQRTHWFAYVNGKPVGALAARAGERPEFLLVTDGGPALFDAVEITELVDPTP